MVPPSLRSELVKVMLCAFAALEPSALTPSAAIQKANFVIAIPSLTICRDWLVAPGAGFSNSNFWDRLEAKGAMQRFAGSSQTSRHANDVPSDAPPFDDIRLAPTRKVTRGSSARCSCTVRRHEVDLRGGSRVLHFHVANAAV